MNRGAAITVTAMVTALFAVFFLYPAFSVIGEAFRTPGGGFTLDFVGDIFRNPQAVFCLHEPPVVANASPFDLHLATEGDDFAVMGMHFKLGLYEHQSAGAIQATIDLLQRHPAVLERPDDLTRVIVTIYEPAFSIISDPAKRDPRTRQSADHSLYYIVAALLRKAIEHRKAGWEELMLLPDDYSDAARDHFRACDRLCLLQPRQNVVGRGTTRTAF